MTAAGGDEAGYFRLAEMIYDLKLQRHTWTLGFPLAVTPFLFVFGPRFEDVFLPIVIFNGFILYGAAIALVVWGAWMVFGRVLAAFWSGFLFSFFPVVFYIFRDFGPHFSGGTWNDGNFVHANWLSWMSDPLSSFFTLSIFCLLLWSLKRDSGLPFYSFLGFLGGYSMMVRLSNIVVLAIVGAVILWRFEWKKLLFFSAFSMLGFLPQLMYNSAFFGSPIKFGYQQEYVSWIAIGAAARPIFSIENFMHLVARATQYSWLAIPAFIFIAGIAALGAYSIIRRNRLYGFIVLAWFLGPTLFYIFFTTGQTTMRYYFPAVPAFILLGVGAVLWTMERIRALKAPVSLP
ncbi:hypothetical protein HYV22_02795 [Candidatus Gottesmanbacteria bacterium]|nr:hypothetical protein [Candidatus Gottesmanbacteria bacterium]